MLKIAHVSDIHIRPYSRHQEYREAFENLYRDLEQKCPDLIVLTGDILHSKTNVSPELFDITTDFFSCLAKIAPLHLILGNHDGIILNEDRLDAISPIVKALNSDRVMFYKKSGVYRVDDNTNFVVMSCFEDETKWPKSEELDKTKLNIGLFHGPINGIVINDNVVMESQYELSMFDGLDYVLLGDIHQTLFLGDKFRIAYPGSLIGQNFGESLDKGYLWWQIESKENHDVDFVKLPNVCPFYTITLNDDLYVIPNLNIQKGSRVRVVSRQLSAEEEKEIKENVQSYYSPVELRFVDDLSDQQNKTEISKSVYKIENLRDLSTQERLLKHYFKEKNVSPEVMSRVLDLNKKYSHAISGDDAIRNVKYQIKNLKFSNMFSYGENNSIDFTTMKGIVGFLGPNGSGKSGLAVDIPLYCLYNKVSKNVVKNNLYINENHDHCSAEMEIVVDDTSYFIERKTHVQKLGKRKGQTKDQGVTSVNFYSKNRDKVTSLNGTERSDTDSNIRHRFGTAEDFMITAVAPQFELLGLINTKGTERKNIIGRYLDLDIFQQKYKAASEDFRVIKKQVQLIENKNYKEEISALEQQLQSNESSVQLAKEKIKKLEADKDEKDKLLLEKSVELGTVVVAAPKNLTEASTILFEIKRQEKSLMMLSEELGEFKKYPCIKNPECCLKQKELSTKQKLLTVKNSLEKLNNDYVSLKAQQEIDSKSADEERKKVAENLGKEIEKLKNEILAIKLSLTPLHSKIEETIRNSGISLHKIEMLKKEQEVTKKLLLDHEAHSLFVNAMNKDGIAYSIILNNLSVINKQIKKILSSIDFNITLEDDEQEINIYFHHKKSKKRLIELASGMERSVAAIALRAALLNVTSLPTPNILVLDEAFTSLDATYLQAIGGVLQNLKTYFDTIIVISHDDKVKDLCDTVLVIERDSKGFSRVRN